MDWSKIDQFMLAYILGQS